MRILVVGGAGLLGTWISRGLQLDGHEIFVLDNFSVGLHENIMPGMDYTAGDASNPDIVHNVFRCFKPEVVYNLAADAREGTSSLSPVSCVRNNLQVHLNLLVEGIRSNSFRKMVYFSSQGVYGGNIPPFDETDNPIPVDPYGQIKLTCENYTKQLAEVHGFEYTIIRPHNVFGEYVSLRDRGRNVIAIFINQCMRREPITIYGDGSSKRAFSYIANSLPCYINVLNNYNKEIFNVGDDEVVSIKDLAYLVKKIMSQYGYRTSQIQHLTDRPLEIKTGYSTTHKQKQIGYVKTIALEEGIERTAAWAVKHGPQAWLNMPLELPIVNRMPESWR